MPLLSVSRGTGFAFRPTGRTLCSNLHHRQIQTRRLGRYVRLPVFASQGKPVKLNGAEDVASLAKLAAELSSKTATAANPVVKPPTEEEDSKKAKEPVKDSTSTKEAASGAAIGTATEKKSTAVEVEKKSKSVALLASKPTVIMPPEAVKGVEANVKDLTLTDLSYKDDVYNIELNWLMFNWRVLAMSEDESTPLFERLKFLAITASNLDEFFCKRVGGLMRQRAAGLSNLVRMKKRWSPSYQLELISQEVGRMVRRQSSVFYEKLLPEMKKQGVRILRHSDINQEGVKELAKMYKTQIEALLTPIKLDPGHPFPYLDSGSINLAVLLEDPRDSEQKIECAIVSIPDSLDRWKKLTPDFALPDDCWTAGFLPVEEIIIHHINELFGGMKLIGVHPFRVTRNADLARNEEEAEDLLSMIAAELRERKFAPFVRLEVNEGAPDDLIDLLTSELHLDFDQDVYKVPHMVEHTDLFQLISLAEESVQNKLRYVPTAPQTNHRLAQKSLRRKDLSRSGTSWKDRRSIFSIIRAGDILVHHPYQSFDSSTLRFLEESASDPNVLAIKTTVYRTSADSPVIEALLKARENGKNVTVLVEIKARFDEARNCDIAQKLEHAGCHVAYGLVGVKTHCKTMLVVRRERRAPNGLRSYVHTGTGNYNPSTAKLYTDFGLLTCDPDLCQDVVDLFKHLTGLHNQKSVGGYKKLLLCSEFMQKQFLDLIDQEIAFAKDGKPAAICLKMNGLDERVMVEKLYEASQAGVRIDCIVRGICRLRPGVPELSENIRVISIIGRYLEHDRVACFHNNGDPLYFLGSADWLPRNIYDRVEVVAPVQDENLKAKIRDYLSICLFDRQDAWEMLPDQRYQKPASRTEEATLSAPLIGHPEPAKLKRIATDLGTQNALIKLYEMENKTGISWNSENADIDYDLPVLKEA